MTCLAREPLLHMYFATICPAVYASVPGLFDLDSGAVKQDELAAMALHVEFCADH